MATPRNDTYSAPSGAVVRGGRNGLSRDVALIGDSLTAYTGYNWSPFFWINGLAAKGAQRLIANAGVASETAANILARVNNPYNGASPGLAGLPPLGIVYVRVGTNDARSSTPIGSLSATLTSLLNAIRTYAQQVVILSVPPIGVADGGDFATKNQRTLDYNAWYSAFAAANPSWCRYVDDSANLRNPDGSQRTEYFQDGIHNIGKATYVQGRDAALALAPFFAGFAFVSPLSLNPADVYPAQPQWVTNPTMGGSYSGSGNWPGTATTGFGISSNGSGINGAVSRVAADVGDPNQTTWQRITPAQITRNTSADSIRITSALSGRAISTTDPDRFDIMVELRFNNFDSAKYSGFKLWVQGNTGTRLTPDLELKMGEGVINHTMTLRQALPRIGPTANASATLYFDALFNASFTGAMGSFDFRCCTVRG